MDQALYSALAGALMPSPEAEGRVARTGLWKMLSEWRFLLLLLHVGEGQPGKKLPANSRNSHLLPPPPTNLLCHMSDLPGPSLPFFNQTSTTGSAPLNQRRKLRPREVVRLDADQA